ncbi:hypothetical protein D3C80_1724570 [compost metagenome]
MARPGFLTVSQLGAVIFSEDGLTGAGAGVRPRLTLGAPGVNGGVTGVATLKGVTNLFLLCVNAPLLGVTNSGDFFPGVC